MYAVVVRVKIGDREAAEKGLREQVVPRVKEAPGFVAGYWTRPAEGGGDDGLSMILLESEEGARRAAEMIRGGGGVLAETVTLESVEVRQVVEHAERA